MADAVEGGTGQATVGQLSVAAEKRESSGRPCTVVSLTGRVDETERDQLRKALHSAARRGPAFVLIDLSAVPSIDVTGVRELVRVRAVMSGLGRVVALVSPSPGVAQFLESCGANQLMPVYPDVAAAMAG
ncbi:MAG: STAS domain-containing protein [Actinobacteria bacterium]|nr:STAS domain-containing protein [Actinomycetota bacterium]